MKSMTIDKLTEQEMEKVRQFLAQMPNKPHQGKFNECYGDYVAVESADIKGNIVSKYFHYENVRFMLKHDACVLGCPYDERRCKEYNQTWQGLMALIAEFTQLKED